MNCLTEGEIQSYLDGELLDLDFVTAKEHLISCPHCSQALQRLQSNKAEIFEILNQLDQHYRTIEIPAFKPNVAKNNRISIIAISSIAASILIFLGLFNLNQNKKKVQYEQTLNVEKATIELTRNLDPNKMNHENKMIIVITNDEGEVVESYLTE